MEPIVVRSISREYRIRTPSSELAAILGFLEARPEIEGSSLIPVELAVEPVPDGFRLTLPMEAAVEASAAGSANRIFLAIVAGIRDEAPGAPLVHGASLVSEGARLLLLGKTGSGKTTLTLRLLARGFEVEGDEHVVLRDDDAISRPRRIQVKPGSLPLLPDLREAILGSPVLPDEFGNFVHAVDPSIAGRPWRIRPGQVHHLVFLEPNHGGGSSLSPLGPDEAFARLMADSLLSERPLVSVARLRRLACEVPACRLMLGDLARAEDHLRRLLREGHSCAT